MTGPDQPPPPPGPKAPHVDGAEYDVQAAIRPLVDKAPPLSAEQRARLAVLLAPAPSDSRRVA